ncbi:EAL domain-containing protein [Accumulibacter sp.]|uniref:two-component system response regulator n=1 Tax=Accumulibacter sp. TaxID=2053492 RepID=UPI0028C418E9|nr:EAL domain-containing protein [Accumulibacter sp.]
MDSTAPPNRVLLVDDDEMLRMLAAESLRHAGFEVSEAECGEAALRACQESDFDLLLLDVMMPGIDGYTVCETLRRDARAEWLPIVMLTGLNDSDSIERAYAAGATDFVTKPINWHLLTHRVRYALRTSRAMAEVRRSEQSLALAQRQARMGNWQWLLDEARFSCSDELRRIFGDVELAGTGTPKRFLHRVRSNDRDAVAAARQALLSEGAPYRLTYGMQRVDGGLTEVLEEALAVRDAAGRIVRIEGITQDVTERVQAEQRIQHLAMHDALTGLANRQFFAELVGVELARVRRTQGSCCAILHLDLDHFKSANDALGDAAGDQLLCEIAARLQASVRAADLLALNPPMQTAGTVARIDGDAFTVLLVDVRVATHVAMVAERLLQEVSRPLLFAGRELVLTACVGMALFPRDADSAESLWRHAEQAMYVAKRAGASRCRFFDEKMNSAASAKLQLENELRHAIARNELRLHFQPKVDATNGQMVSAAALVRWQHPQRGLLAPGEFIPLAEECGLIVALGDWVVAAAARHLRQWADAGLATVRVSVNLASPSFLQDDIAEKLAATVQRAGVSPQQLLVELTESLLMVDAERTIARLNKLREQGFALALDDFGTGYSSLSYLKRFPLDELKIDRSFVSDVARGGKDAAIALSIIELGKQFGMRVVAEGIETHEQAAFLLAHGCNIQQGFLFSKPLPQDRFEALLAAGGRLACRQLAPSPADPAESAR